jgi:hypothetical protein
MVNSRRYSIESLSHSGSLEVFGDALFLYLNRPVTGTRRKPLMLRKTVTITLIAAAAGVFLFREAASSYFPMLAGEAQAAGSAEDAFRNHRSGVMVTAEGSVIRLLADDNDGSRHQRFIIRLASGQTLLIAHNIDLSTRVPVQQNVLVKLHGQFEWSEKGGTVHWTHRDPKQKHEAGWIEISGQRYN